MSVNLNSANGKVSENVCNGSWAAATRVGHYFDDSIPAWNGCHDGQNWTPEQLEVIALRCQQLGELVKTFSELAKNGGVYIS